MEYHPENKKHRRQEWGLAEDETLDVPVPIVMATTVATVLAEITRTATDSAPTYIATTKANSTDTNPPAAARDMTIEVTMAVVVAAARRNVKTRRTVSGTEATDPTCGGSVML